MISGIDCKSFYILVLKFILKLYELFRLHSFHITRHYSRSYFLYIHFRSIRSNITHCNDSVKSEKVVCGYKRQVWISFEGGKQRFPRTCIIGKVINLKRGSLSKWIPHPNTTKPTIKPKTSINNHQRPPKHNSLKGCYFHASMPFRNWWAS